MSKITCFAVGWLAEAATVVTDAVLADSLQQSYAVFGEDEKYTTGEEERSGLIVS